MRLETSACAKLNLTLDVLGRREDGYHELKMVSQTVDLRDDIVIDIGDGVSGFTARSNRRFLPTDSRNLAVKAAELFISRTGINAGGTIDVHKRIPVCAGLGGGSADAAAVLRALNGAFGHPLSRDELYSLAGELGSDVPFCLEGGTRLMEGRGELLTRLSPMPDCRILIVKPQGSLSTPEVFGWFKASKLRRRPDTVGVIAALERGDLPGVARRVFNVLEEAVSPRMREVAELHARLISCGATGASMTGTGSAVFGIFDSDKAASEAEARIAGKHRETFIVRPDSGHNVQK